MAEFQPRLSKVQRDPVIQPEHKLYLKRNADEFLIWANGIGTQTVAVIEGFLTSSSEPKQGYKACARLQSFQTVMGMSAW